MTAAGGAALDCADVVKAYGTTEALTGASLTCHHGTITVLLGHNGAGKSTLLRAAAGLVVPDGGDLRIEGWPAGTRQAKQLVSFLPEQPDLYSGLSVWEHVSFVALAYRLPRRDWPGHARALLARFGLTDRLDALPHELSQGLRRRLGLVLALLHGARVLLLDEPFNGLDPRSVLELREVLRSLAADGACVVVSDHLLAGVESFAGTVVLLDHGRVVAGGTTADLARRAGLPVTAGLEDAYLVLTDRAQGGVAGRPAAQDAAAT